MTGWLVLRFSWEFTSNSRKCSEYSSQNQHKSIFGTGQILCEGKSTDGGSLLDAAKTATEAINDPVSMMFFLFLERTLGFSWKSTYILSLFSPSVVAGLSLIISRESFDIRLGFSFTGYLMVTQTILSWFLAKTYLTGRGPLVFASLHCGHSCTQKFPCSRPNIEHSSNNFPF